MPSPPSRNDIPLSGHTNSYIPLLQQAQVGTGLVRQTHDFLSTLQLAEFLPPFIRTKFYHLLIRLDAQQIPLGPQPQQSELCTWFSQCTNENVLI